jgi:SNF2 family DNA or RNA helicase
MVATAMSNPTEEDSQATVDDIADELAGLMGGLGVANEAKCELCFTVLADQNAKQCTECEEISGTSIKKKGGNTNLPPYSTKIRKMLQLLKSVEERSGGKEKTIIFSQFTSFLNILEPFLQDAGFNYVRCGLRQAGHR